MNPIIPHFSSECLEQLNSINEIEWPKVDDKFLIKKDYQIVVQINGKKRDIIISNKELDEKELIEKIMTNEKVIKFLKDVKIKKTIYITNKLINLIV